MKVTFLKYLSICLAILISTQNSFTSEPVNEEDWWGIKCRELPGSFGHSIDKGTIFINLPDGITGCDALIVKAPIIYIETPAEFLEDIVNHKGLEIWAREYYINNVNYKPHHNVGPLWEAPVFTINDQNHSIHQALVAARRQKISSPLSDVYINNQLDKSGENTFNFTPEANIIGELKGLFNLIKGHFTQNIFSPSKGMLIKLPEGEYHLWEMPDPVKIQLLNATSSFPLMGCRKHDWGGKVIASRTVEDFKKLFKELLSEFNNFHKTLMASSDVSHGCHTILYNEDCMKNDGVVPLVDGCSTLFVAKHPRTDGQIDLLRGFLGKESKYTDSGTIENLAKQKEILNVPAMKIEPFSTYPKLGQDGFGMSIGLTKDFVSARFTSSVGHSNKEMIRLDFFTKLVQNDEVGIPVDDF